MNKLATDVLRDKIALNSVGGEEPFNLVVDGFDDLADLGEVRVKSFVVDVVARGELG